MLADVLAQLGRTEDAREAFEALAAADFEVHVEMQWLVSLSLMPELCRYLRDPGRAETLYEALRPYARHNATTPPELCLGSVSRGLGILAATMSNWDAATGHFDDALEMNAAMGARPWIAHTQYDYGCMLLARDHRGDRERAQELATAARALSDDLGMQALSGSVARLMRSEASVP